MQSKNHNSVERPSPRWRTTLAGGDVLTAAVSVVVTIVAAALACGPFFPNRFITGGDMVATQLASVNFRSMLKDLTPKVSGGAVKLEGARYRYVEEMSGNGADIQNESTWAVSVPSRRTSLAHARHGLNSWRCPPSRITNAPSGLPT